MSFTTGDFVTRKSYQHDLLFRIIELDGDIAILHGEDVRLLADAPLSDLEKIGDRDLKKRKAAVKEKEEQSFQLFRQDYRLMKRRLRHENEINNTEDIEPFQIPIKVLHLDSDVLYLNKCLSLYKRLGIDTVGLHVKEKEMPEKVEEHMEKHRPDCIVITGHDALSKKKSNQYDLKSYRHSRYFVEAVKRARTFEPNYDELVIFGGACQSYFESLIRAGANFASSPSRVNIHALDPVYIVAKVAYTSFMEKVNVLDIIRNSLTGTKGMGGIETRGLQRTGMPYIDEKEIKKKTEGT